ncbi:MAG TPA: hypothetical protein VFA10_27010, partial [Ktedonobacteraceae bacterium]|nr:hypothetical protein [Ktedonobacteraceae bacterium]
VALHTTLTKATCSWRTERDGKSGCPSSFCNGPFFRWVVGAAFITPAFEQKPQCPNRPGGRDECCPDHPPRGWLPAKNDGHPANHAIFFLFIH